MVNKKDVPTFAHRYRQMTEKITLLQKLMPVAILKPTTPEAGLTVSQLTLVEGVVPLRHFPFRVGRESRVKISEGRVERTERVAVSTVPPTNDLYLVDDGPQLNISREHFQIEKDGNSFYLYDRGSECGTVVGNQQLSDESGELSVQIRDGDIITVGAKDSKYTFQFIVLEGFEIRPSE